MADKSPSLAHPVPRRMSSLGVNFMDGSLDGASTSAMHAMEGSQSATRQQQQHAYAASQSHPQSSQGSPSTLPSSFSSTHRMPLPHSQHGGQTMAIAGGVGGRQAYEGHENASSGNGGGRRIDDEMANSHDTRSRPLPHPPQSQHAQSQQQQQSSSQRGNAQQAVSPVKVADQIRALAESIVSPVSNYHHASPPRLRLKTTQDSSPQQSSSNSRGDTRKTDSFFGTTEALERLGLGRDDERHDEGQNQDRPRHAQHTHVHAHAPHLATYNDSDAVSPRSTQPGQRHHLPHSLDSAVSSPVVKSYNQPQAQAPSSFRPPHSHTPSAASTATVGSYSSSHSQPQLHSQPGFGTQGQQAQGRGHDPNTGTSNSTSISSRTNAGMAAAAAAVASNSNAATRNSFYGLDAPSSFGTSSSHALSAAHPSRSYIGTAQPQHQQHQAQYQQGQQGQQLAAPPSSGTSRPNSRPGSALEERDSALSQQQQQRDYHQERYGYPSSSSRPTERRASPSSSANAMSTSAPSRPGSMAAFPRSGSVPMGHSESMGAMSAHQQQQHHGMNSQHYARSPSVSQQSLFNGAASHHSTSNNSNNSGNSASASNDAQSRRRVASWGARSQAGSVYGMNLASPITGGGGSGSTQSNDLPLPPVPQLSQAHLRPGEGVSLLSHQKTLDMYRANVKKTNDPEITFEFATFMLGVAREMANLELVAQMHGAQQNVVGGGGGNVPGGIPVGAVISDENLMASLNNDPQSSSPSPDPSISFHSRSSGSSGDLAAAGAAARQSGGSGRRKSHSPVPSISLPAFARNLAGQNRSSSPTTPSSASAAAPGGGPQSAGGAAGSSTPADRRALVAEAMSLLKRSADRGHVASQYLLADIYANGSMDGGAASGNGGAGGAGTAKNRGSIYAQARERLPSLPSMPGAGALGLTSHSAAASPVDAYGAHRLSVASVSPTGSSASLAHNPSQNGPNSAVSPSIGPQKQDFDKALPLFIAAAKHGHAPSAYRAGQCLENGWGCRKDAGKAVQFYRKSAAASFPEAMYRLGMAELNGELGLKDRQKEGFKWLKQVAALAESINDTSNSSGNANANGLEVPGAGGAAMSISSSASGMMSISPGSNFEDLDNHSNNPAAARQCTVQALHELALLHERGIDNVVFVDNEYAAELLARASELGYAPSAYKLGECYEYGRMGCPQNAALSIHYYNIAAQQNHKEACFALTAWYLVGSPGVLPQSDTEAYLWAKKAAEQGLAKAEYAVGYFTEVGIGTLRDERDAVSWFQRAAEHGDKRALTRLKTLGVRVDDLEANLAATGSAANGGYGNLSAKSPRSPKSATGGINRRSRYASDAPAPDPRRASGDHSSRGRKGSNAAATTAGGENGGAATKKKSRRNTLPGLMGLSNSNNSGPASAPPMPDRAGKKADGDCVIS